MIQKSGFERLFQFAGGRDRRLAGGSRTQNRKRFALAQLRKRWNRSRQYRRKIFCNHLVGLQAKHGLVKSKGRNCRCVEFVCIVFFCDYDHLHRTLEKMRDCDPVGRGENSKLLGYSSKGFERLLGLIAILGLAGVVMQAQPARSPPSDFPPASANPAGACAA